MTGDKSVTTRKKPQQFQQAMEQALDKFELQERQLSKSERLERAAYLDLPETEIERLKAALH